MTTGTNSCLLVSNRPLSQSLSSGTTSRLWKESVIIGAEKLAPHASEHLEDPSLILGHGMTGCGAHEARHVQYEGLVTVLVGDIITPTLFRHLVHRLGQAFRVRTDGDDVVGIVGHCGRHRSPINLEA